MKFPFEMAFWLVLGRLAFKRDILPQSNSQWNRIMSVFSWNGEICRGKFRHIYIYPWHVVWIRLVVGCGTKQPFYLYNTLKTKLPRTNDQSGEKSGVSEAHFVKGPCLKCSTPAIFIFPLSLQALKKSPSSCNCKASCYNEKTTRTVPVFESKLGKSYQITLQKRHKVLA